MFKCSHTFFSLFSLCGSSERGDCFPLGEVATTCLNTEGWVDCFDCLNELADVGVSYNLSQAFRFCDTKIIISGLSSWELEPSLDGEVLSSFGGEKGGLATL